MKKNCCIVIISVLTFSLFSTLSVKASQIKNLPKLNVVQRVGQSELLQSGKIRVLLLQGSPYQMGYAHGKLLASEVKKVMNNVLVVARAADSKRKGNFFANTLEHIYKKVWPYVPARYKEELAGLADGAGLDRHKVALTNIFPEMFHCSGFAMMGKATRGGKLIHGRILDYMTYIDLQDYSVVIVSKPNGCNTTMTASFAGFVGCVTGMNEKQVAIGEMGLPDLGKWNGEPMAFMLRQVLEESDTLGQALNFMKRTYRTENYAYVLSDAKLPSAVAIHSTPKLLELVHPGEANPMLPTPVPDCVLASAGKRYELLVKRTKKYYGKIDPDIAVEIMKRPVSMDSNLHDAIMIPEDKIMYLAVAGNPKDKRYQACYQPYYKYDMNTYISMLKTLAAKNKPTKPERISLSEPNESAIARLTPKVQNLTQRGIVPAKFHRAMKPNTNAKLTKLLKTFDTQAEAFPFQTKLLNETEYYKVLQVTFPSPYTSPDPENNTVWCEYFKSKKKGPKPAVIVLHILQGDFTISRIICHSLAVRGIDAILVKMAYYGPRRPKEKSRQKTLSSNVKYLLNGVRQSVMDIRRAAAFLAYQKDVDKNKIDICGVSLGALVGALTIGVDGNFPKAALVIGGGDLAGIISAHSKEVKGLTQYMKEHNMSFPDLTKTLVPIEPLTYITRASNTKVLMMNAKDDKIIPSKCTKELAEKLPHAKLIWYDAGHYSMIWNLLDVVTKIQNFFLNN